MAKEYVYLKGKGSWFQHFFNADSKFGDAKWHITLHPDEESLAKFKSLNLKNTIGKDDDGWYVRLSRPCRKVTRKGQELIWTAPVMFDKDGIPLDQSVRIGNGSDITVKCEVYQYSAPSAKEKSNAIRLESARIDQLVPFDGTKDYTKEENKQADGLMVQPKPIF
jgi:hypothetical protein